MTFESLMPLSRIETIRSCKRMLEDYRLARRTCINYYPDGDNVTPSGRPGTVCLVGQKVESQGTLRIKLSIARVKVGDRCRNAVIPFYIETLYII